MVTSFHKKKYLSCLVLHYCTHTILVGGALVGGVCVCVHTYMCVCVCVCVCMHAHIPVSLCGNWKNEGSTVNQGSIFLSRGTSVRQSDSLSWCNWWVLCGTRCDPVSHHTYRRCQHQARKDSHLFLYRW